MASLPIPEIKVGDWNSVRVAFQKLKSLLLGTDAIPTFAGITLSKTCLVAAGLNVLRVTGLQTDDIAMSGTLRGVYIDVSNGSTAATGTIRGMELKARTEAPGDTGNDVAVLEGLSISADSKGHSVTTMRAAEFILDGKTGGTIGEAVGLRIANNLQANKATVSYGLQIYRDSFDYTADIQLSSGGLIGGASGHLKITSGGNVSITSLTASRLMASNASKVLVSSDLASWVTQTANQVLVADDGDGTITLSTPQDIHTGASPTFADLTGTSFIIGPYTCEETEWDYLSNINQYLSTIGTPSFAELTLSSANYPVLGVTRTSTVTNLVRSGIKFIHETNQVAITDGFGLSFVFVIKDAGGESTIGRLVAVRDGADNEGKLQFLCGTDGAEEFMSIDSGGTVDIPVDLTVDIIGEHTGAAGVTIAGDTGIKIKAPTGFPRFEFYHAAARKWLIYSDASYKFQWKTDTDIRMTLQQDGNLGIGETSPQDKLEVNGTVLIKDKLKFTQDDGLEFIDSLADGYMDYGATTAHRFNTPVRGATSLWWRIQHVDLSALPATGAVGAVYTLQSVNNLTGYQLDNAPSEEYLYFNTHVGTDWDEASDMELVVQFETNADNSAGDGTDTVDFDLVMYYKGPGESTQKTQDLDASVVVGAAVQFTHGQVTFTIDYDLVNHVVQIGDCVSFALHLNDDTPLTQVVNVIAHHAMFRYRTNKPRAEV